MASNELITRLRSLPFPDSAGPAEQQAAAVAALRSVASALAASSVTHNWTPNAKEQIWDVAASLWYVAEFGRSDSAAVLSHRLHRHFLYRRNECVLASNTGLSSGKALLLADMRRCARCVISRLSPNRMSPISLTPFQRARPRGRIRGRRP